MTTAKIEKKAARAMLPFKLATEVRQLLDAAKKASGLSAEEWSEVEREILELVGEEE